MAVDGRPEERRGKRITRRTLRPTPTADEYDTIESQHAQSIVMMLTTATDEISLNNFSAIYHTPCNKFIYLTVQAYQEINQLNPSNLIIDTS